MLKHHIIQSELSRQQWATRLGVSKSYLSMLENAKKVPSLVLAVKIENLTGGKVPAASWVSDPAVVGGE
ncbi:helix-turn-helix domain-containing protein [Falsihalocynthiibacter sp. CO-5D18]|uniref:helix-turn-helix domain-containing protein n=1 Tax=Falsihalocynthiibacter sp. CO-5D18 TaxID=3240872 RepID=UPI0035108F14